jgi:V8-like Glu-specific endopeptidase
MLSFWILSLVVVRLLLSSSTSPQDEKIIYDNDGRREFYEVHSSVQELVSQSIVVLIPKYALDCNGDDCEVGVGMTYGEARDLCDGETYEDQPIGGFCSGTLVGRDRVVSAGHCFTESTSCSGTYLVFNFHYTSSGNLAPISKSRDVYECRRVFAELEDEGTKDWSLIQLDREVDDSHSPVTISSDHSVAANDQLVLIGFPSGLPCKIDATAIATATEDWGFYSIMDSFGGNSGSGVFKLSSLEMIGILVRGNQDFEDNGDCSVESRVSSSSYDSNQFEQCSYVHRILDQAPVCVTTGDCDNDGECVIEDGLDGFCDAGWCPATCFGTSGCHSTCLTCNGGTRQDCLSCFEGYEVDVIYTDCSGECVPEGTADVPWSYVPQCVDMVSCTELCDGVVDGYDSGEGDDDIAQASCVSFRLSLSLVLIFSLVVM